MCQSTGTGRKGPVHGGLACKWEGPVHGGVACKWEGPVHGGGACRWEGSVHKDGACRWEGQQMEKVVALVGVDSHLHFTVFDFCTFISH